MVDWLFLWPARVQRRVMKARLCALVTVQLACLLALGWSERLMAAHRQALVQALAGVAGMGQVISPLRGGLQARTGQHLPQPRSQHARALDLFQLGAGRVVALLGSHAHLLVVLIPA